MIAAEEFWATAARKLFFAGRSRRRRRWAVPGVMTRVTSRRTSFLPGPGCSICSQMADFETGADEAARCSCRA